ncbi:hypothetical protein EJ04DRAFT_578430 [Polyplosphaeria fusca]|uniref:Uncharacterized protein n=1 Tax=Polyplosphaeria fusca TaxID=682080 RepID=A0A9P4V0P2_9PLEO|nr:hypothetical protein EJ04DRAFT_578430 [Polyplosphaeria fusca]
MDAAVDLGEQEKQEKQEQQVLGTNLNNTSASEKSFQSQCVTGHPKCQGPKIEIKICLKFFCDPCRMLRRHAQAQSAYDSLSSVSRPSAKVANEFLDNPSFQEGVNKAPVFPLMELPTEIRILIAEFALYREHGLWWILATGYRRGYFFEDYLDFREAYLWEHDEIRKPCNQLKYVCRTLYNETKGIQFKVNTLRFEKPFNDDLQLRGHVHLRHVQSFFDTVPAPWILSAIKNIAIIYRAYEREEYELLCLPSEYQETVRAHPAIAFQMVCRHWSTGDEWGRIVKLPDFLNKGRKVKDMMDKLRSTGGAQNVRVFPMDHVRDHRIEMMKGCEPNEATMISEWFENGI